MPISFALSNSAFPTLTLEELALHAKTLGFGAVELRTLEGQGGLASDPLLSRSANIAKVLGDEGLTFVCLSTELSLDRHDAQSRKDAREKLLRFLDIAAEAKAGAVRVLVNEWTVGWSKLAMIHAIAEQSIELAKLAGDRNVQLLFENQGPITSTRDWWDVINMINHPRAGLIWNAAQSSLAGESPSVSIPTLNSRIRLVRLMDYQLSPTPAAVAMGQGQLQLDHIIKRLMGIGYQGSLCMEYDCLGNTTANASKEAAATYLQNSVAKVREIFASLAPAPAKPKPAAKPAAAPAAAVAAK